MKKLLLLLLAVPILGFGQAANFYLLPLEIVGFHNIVEGQPETIEENTIIYVLDNTSIQLHTGFGYPSLPCPCIIGDGNTIAHSGGSAMALKYSYDETSSVKPISIFGEDSFNTWTVPEDKFWFVTHTNLYMNGKRNNIPFILTEGQTFSTSEINLYLFAIEVDVNSYNYSLSYKENSIENDLFKPTLYPNPTSSLLALNSDKDYDIEVYDMAGNKVMALTGNTIDMSHLSSAAYIVKALDKVENEEVSYKVVKN